MPAKFHPQVVATELAHRARIHLSFGMLLPIRMTQYSTGVL
jgi:hypothetical protein